MAWASLYFSVRLVSCCKNGTTLIIHRTYETVQYITTQPNFFYCRHVHFCAISSGFINTRPAGSGTMKMSVSPPPPKLKKKPKQTLPPWILPPAVNSPACAETLIVDVFFTNDYFREGIGRRAWRVTRRRKVSSCRNRGDKRETYACFFFFCAENVALLSASLYACSHYEIAV